MLELREMLFEEMAEVNGGYNAAHEDGSKKTETSTKEKIVKVVEKVVEKAKEVASAYHEAASHNPISPNCPLPAGHTKP